MARAVRRNHLLSKPPDAHHRLRNVARIAGKPVTPDLYLGVHTANLFALAASYAVSTAQKCRCGFPVIIELDVSGLKPLPDVDAMLAAEHYLMDSSARERAQEIVDEYDHISDAAGEYSMNEYESEGDVRVGSPWQNAIVEDFNAVNLGDAFQQAYDDDDVAWVEFEKYAKTGKIDDVVLAALTSQRRWLHDFDASRVQRVYTIKPVWDDIVDNYWDSDDPDEKARVEKIEAAGYTVMTLDDAYNQTDILEKELLYEKRGLKKGSGEFHGTASKYFKQAFPEIKIPDESPFQVTEVEED